MKLFWPALLAMVAFAMSAPLNEEERREEITNLLRELLLVDLEDELANAKRDDSEYAYPVSLEAIEAVKAAFLGDRSFVVLQLQKSTVRGREAWQWVVKDQKEGGPYFTQDLLNGIAEDLKRDYLRDKQKYFVIVPSTSPPSQTVAGINWMSRGAASYISAVKALRKSLLPTALGLHDPDRIQPMAELDWTSQNDIDFTTIFKCIPGSVVCPAY